MQGHRADGKSLFQYRQKFLRFSGFLLQFPQLVPGVLHHFGGSGGDELLVGQSAPGAGDPERFMVK